MSRAVAAAVAAAVALATLSGCTSPVQENGDRAVASAPAWARLDRTATGTADEKRVVLVERLERFLTESIEAVAPDARFEVLDPLGRLGCGSGESTEARSAIITGVPPDRVRELPDRFVALWESFGYRAHRVEQVSSDRYDTVSINGFHIEVALTATVPLRLEGSIPCVGGD